MLVPLANASLLSLARAALRTWRHARAPRPAPDDGPSLLDRLDDDAADAGFHAALVRAMGDGLWAVGSDGRTTFVNDAMAGMLGYARGELLARPLWDFLDPAARRRAEAHGALPDGEAPPRLEVTFRRKDGAPLRTWLVTTRLPSPAFNGACALATVTDMREPLASERALEEARQRAEAASRAKSQFLASMSHEIRTPLSAIVGFCDLLRDPDLTSVDRQEFTERICRASGTLARIIDDILDLSKVEAGKLEFQWAPVALPDVLHDVHAMLALKARDKGLRFELVLADALPASVVTDRLRVQQILTNLAGNALKFTAKGAVRLTARHDAAAGVVRIAVADTGVGIPPEDVAKLFQDYTQVGAATSGRFGGTGLGLVLSRRLARALGGDLRLVESAPGTGTVFELTLPTGDGIPGPYRDLRFPTALTAVSAIGPAVFGFS